MTIIPAYCHNGSVHHCFLQSLFGFMGFDAANRKLALGVLPEKGLYIDDNRNNLARKFLKTKADYMLSLDTDMEFHHEVPYALLDEAEKNDRPILSALYFSFIIDGKLRPVWFLHAKEGGGVRNIGNLKIGEIVELAAVGMGCCLIRRDVFDELEKVAAASGYERDGRTLDRASWPWFGREPFELNGVPMRLGEDVSFCLRAGRLGFKTWGHAGVEAVHEKSIKADFNLFRMFYEDAKRRNEDY